MQQDLNYEELVDRFYTFEKKYNLQQLKDQEVYIWNIIRFYVFLELVSKKQKIQTVHLQTPKTQKLSRIIKTFWNAIFKNPLLKKQRDNIIIDHPRKVLFKDMEIDPYTHFFFKDMKKEKYLLLERKYVGKYNKSSISTNTTMDFFSVTNSVVKKFKKIELSQDIQLILEKIERDFESVFNEKINISKLAKNKYTEFVSLSSVFEWYLKMKKPLRLYVVVSYTLKPYVAAAKKLGIKVIEFQHGVMGPFHVGYHFPYNNDVPYFPDEILMFGKFWEDITRLPKNTQKNYIGYSYLKEHIDSYSKMKVNKEQNQVTIISQGTIGKKLSDMMFLVAKELPKYRFVYKLHPGEFGRWKKEYNMLVEMEKLPNVTVIENETPLYDLFAQSTFVIGVNSTAIFEAIAFKVKPIIVTLPSYEMMKVLHDKHHVPLVNTAAETIDYLLKNQKTDNHIQINDLFAGIE
ncbi:hypothetical protein ACFOZ1_01845 [Gracilibacillus marinus]|uniref:Capsular polysaccharide biosynthesis protein n=1 Tax=Gracilibacillus marinus TaxID=630535 RepID=A0ABV8VQS4_9BACI